MKTTSRFYSSLGLLILLNAIVKPIWVFAIDRQVQNEVGLAEYGHYFAVLNLSIVLGFALDLGITNYLNRQLAGNDPEVISNTGNFLIIKLIFALIFAVLVLAVSWLTGIRRWDLVVGTLLIQFLTSLFVFFRSIITARQLFHIDAWLSILDKLLMILVCGVLLYLPWLFGSISMKRFLVAQISCTAVAILIAYSLVSSRKFLRFSGTGPAIRKIILASAPFATVILLMSLHARLDGFLLERLSGADEAGKYAAAFRLLDAVNMIGYLLASFLLPFIARAWAENRNIDATVLNVRHLLFPFAILFSLIGIFLAPWLQDLLYEHGDLDAVTILQYCLPAFLGYTLVHLYGTVMTATGHLRSFMYINLCAMILNVGLNFLLIPSLGAKASCISAIISQSVCGIAAMWYCRQKLNLRLELRSWLIYTFIAAAVGGFLYVAKGGSWNQWLLIIVSGLIVLLLLLITGLIHPRKWKAATL